MRRIPLLGSLAINASLVILLGSLTGHRPLPRRSPIDVELVEVTSAPPPVATSLSNGGGTPERASDAHGRATKVRARGDAWAGLAMHTEVANDGDGDGLGGGHGRGGGHGTGIGLGDGGGVRMAEPVPPPPVPPPPSRARPAKLIWPTRHLDVEDDSDLFVALVTVDAEGSVVGAHMVKTHPGSRGDHAANAIWTFRYEPALDDAGSPIRSTFEQEFQVR